MTGRRIADLAALAASLLLAGCWGSSTDVRVSHDTDRVSRQVVDKTVEVFRETCRPLFDAHAADVRSIRAIASDESGTEPRRRGWGVHLDVFVELRSSPTTLTGPIDGEARYLMGGGARPGLVAFTPTAAALCGFAPPAGRDQVFVSLPILTSLLPRLRLEPTRAQREWWADELELAMRGDYQSQRNVAWCRYDGCDGVEPIDDVASCAWRMVIAAAKDPRSDASDAGNLDFYCGKALTAADRAEAAARAGGLFAKIYGKPMPK
jgi:hypothetical protein